MLAPTRPTLPHVLTFAIFAFALGADIQCPPPGHGNPPGLRGQVDALREEADRALVVVDANGRRVGTPVDLGGVGTNTVTVIVDLEDLPLFPLKVSTNELHGNAGNERLFFESDDCTGTPYLLTLFTGGIYPDTAVIDGTAYLPTDTRVEIVNASELTSSDCRPGTGARDLRVEAMAVEATREFEAPFELVTVSDL